jgi:hypothetical protein
LEGSRLALEEAESKLGGAGKLGGEQAEEQAWRPWRARVQQARRGAGSLGGLASSSLGGLASSSLGEGGPISVFAVTGVKWTFQRLLQPNGTES